MSSLQTPSPQFHFLFREVDIFFAAIERSRNAFHLLDVLKKLPSKEDRKNEREIVKKKGKKANSFVLQPYIQSPNKWLISI